MKEVWLFWSNLIIKSRFLQKDGTVLAKWSSALSETNGNRKEQHLVNTARAPIYLSELLLEFPWLFLPPCEWRLLCRKTTLSWVSRILNAFASFKLVNICLQHSPFVWHFLQHFILDCVRFILSDALSHVARQSTKFYKFYWDVLRHPLNSSDVAPSTYHLFRFVQKTISGESSYADVKNELDDRIVSKQLDFCGIRLLLDRWTHLVTSFLNEYTLNKYLCYFYKKEVSFLYSKKGAVLYIPLIE